MAKAETPTTAAGPWASEPDVLDFNDEATGLPVHMQRNSFGAWCGYVGVPKDHPWHGKDYSAHVDAPAGFADRPVDIEELGVVNIFCASINATDDLKSVAICLLVRCHGGVTFAEKPYWPEETRADWWFGFDCSHSGDLAPKTLSRYGGDVYRDVDYVKAACASAAADILRASRVEQPQ